ncbi:hypothetical protein [Effusibacillus dendaii]|uniref:Uncharacterized protein n=1 Tax=Effusibacillus dendaii TaxID=2743772 RepID=A0A7I8D8Q0_9BACL|nr:hypothetical protein [Effusibacillus dendaii]BCJ86523.1 hypothetical protein skT53_15080 [Effusibacillus dendaii]
MDANREQLLSLFDRLTPHQQDDVIHLMKTWLEMPVQKQPTETGESPQNPPLQNPSFLNEWHCLNALKKVVENHYAPRVELGYIAFHPDLDSISTAKTRDAAEKMYVLEAAYELKAIFEKDPDSDVFDKEVLETLHKHLHYVTK